MGNLIKGKHHLWERGIVPFVLGDSIISPAPLKHSITDAVGIGCSNHPEDRRTIITLLNSFKPADGGTPQDLDPQKTDIYKLDQAIRQFQRIRLPDLMTPDGRVAPGSPTLIELNHSPDDGNPYEAKVILLDAVKYWNRILEKTIRWEWRHDQKDYVSFENVNEGCSSHVGKKGGKQNLNIGTGFARQLAAECQTHIFCIILHEMGHVVGLEHEQCRIGREKIIWIDRHNVTPERYEKDFQITGNCAPKGIYDFNSIMHYYHNQGAINSSDPVIYRFGADGSHQMDRLMGSRDGFSRGDIETLRGAYAKS